MITIEEIEKRWGCYSHSSDAWIHHQEDIRWLIKKVKSLEADLSIAKHDHETALALRDVMRKRVSELEEGIKHIEIMGHNDDCLMCAMKDTWARKLIK